MLRIDQAQRLIEKPGLFDAVAARLGYRHLDWVSKDTDGQFTHFPRHYVSFDIPDQPDDYLWSERLTDGLKASPGYTSYNDGLGEGVDGIFIIYTGQIVPNPDTPSGWTALFTASFVDPDLPLM